MTTRCIVLAALLISALWAEAQPHRIIVIRHAEKPDNEADPHLSVSGQVRAQRLVRWLTQGEVLGTNGTPAALFAARPSSRGRGVRCIETLDPTARKLGLKIRASYRPEDYDALAREVLRDKSLRGKNAVICWPHEQLPELAAALGIKGGPKKWKDDDFNDAYVITFPNGQAELEIDKQRLKKK